MPRDQLANNLVGYHILNDPKCCWASFDDSIHSKVPRVHHSDIAARSVSVNRCEELQKGALLFSDGGESEVYIFEGK